MATRRTHEDTTSVTLKTIWSVISVVGVVAVALSSGAFVVYNWVSDVNADRLIMKFRLEQLEKAKAEADRQERWSRGGKSK